ncbi:MAG: DUF58 domain-containing protein [Planctomycetales bacterium]
MTRPSNQRRRLWLALWRSWQEEITLPGKLVVYAGLIGAVGMVSVRIPMYFVPVGLGALFVVAMFAGLCFWPKVSIAGRFPEKVIVGQPVTAQFTVRPESRRPIFDLSLGLFELPPALCELHRDSTVRNLSRDETAQVPVTLLALRRGLYELPSLRAYTTFPFNLFRIGLSRRPMGPLLVLPAFEPLARLDLPASRRYQPGGIALTSNVGESPEYVGNREYVPGEPARRLDFRSWARLGRPVVREYQEEYYCRIALILDTWTGADRFAATRRGALRPWSSASRRGAHRAAAGLEGAVSLAASVADALCNGEYVIDLFAAGPELYMFRSGRHTAHFENVLEILACVEPSPRDPFPTITPAVAEEAGNLSAAVCVFLDWDAARADLVRTILEAGCGLHAIVVRDGPTTEPCLAIDGARVRQVTPAEVAAGELEIA